MRRLILDTWRGRLVSLGAVCAILAMGFGLWRSIGGNSSGPQAETNVVSAPRPGETKLDNLSDGTPVWVVGHTDGDVSVLEFATDAPASLASQLTGVREGTTWQPSAGRFYGGGIFDERGRIISLADDEMTMIAPTVGQDLGHYRFEEHGDHLIVGALIEGRHRTLRAPTTADAGRQAVPPSSLVAFDADAASLPVVRHPDQVPHEEGLVVLTLPLVADGSGPVYACEQGPDGAIRPCGRDGLKIEGARAASALDGSITLWTGPSLVRVTGSGALVDPVLLEQGGSAEALARSGGTG